MDVALTTLANVKNNIKSFCHQFLSYPLSANQGEGYSALKKNLVQFLIPSLYTLQQLHFKTSRIRTTVCKNPNHRIDKIKLTMCSIYILTIKNNERMGILSKMFM